MSLHVLGAPLAGLVGAVPAADGAGYESPTTQEFYQPLIGDGPFAVTRASIVILLSVALIGWFLVRQTRRAAIVPSRGQWVTESVYGLVRNGLARDIIGSHDFMRFVPMLFSMFMLILVNNLFGVIPPVQFPTMSRIGFPIALTLIVYVVYHYLGIKKHGFVGYFKSLVPPGPAHRHRADDLRARADHVLHHPAADARTATLRQHVRRPPAAAAVHHRRPVHGHPRQLRAEDRRLRPWAWRSC